MLTDIAAAIVTRLQTITALATATADPQVELAYPAAQVFLAKDARVHDKPGTMRDLQWVVQLTSYGDGLALVDAIRDSLSNYKLPGKGSSTLAVDLVELARIEPGSPYTYLIRASIRVLADSYTTT